MENCPYEGVNNYDERAYYIHKHSALAVIDRYEKEFPDYMRRIFIEHDIMFKKTLKMIETIIFPKLYFETLAPCIEYEKEFIYVCESEEQADELANLTLNLVISNGWKVYHDGLKIIASPPKKGE